MCSPQVRIGDFGVARLMGTQTHFAKTMVGTPYYLSPELCENRPYNDKSDMWALGCILYELCTLTHPFDAGNQGALILKILRGKYPPPPPEYSRPLRELVGLLLARRSERRPSAAMLLAHPAIHAKAAELDISLPREVLEVASRAPQHPRALQSQPQYVNGIPVAHQGARTPREIVAALSALPAPTPVQLPAPPRGRPVPLPVPQRQHVGGNRVRDRQRQPVTRQLSAPRIIAVASSGATPPGPESPNPAGAQPVRARPPAVPAMPRLGLGGAQFVIVRPVQQPAPGSRPTVSQLQALERGEASGRGLGSGSGLGTNLSFVPSQPLLTPRSRAELDEIEQVHSLGQSPPRPNNTVVPSLPEAARTAALALLASEATFEFDEAVGARRAAALAALAGSSAPASPPVAVATIERSAADRDGGGGGHGAEAESEAEQEENEYEGVPWQSSQTAAHVGWRVVADVQGDDGGGGGSDGEEEEEEELGFAGHMRTVDEGASEDASGLWIRPGEWAPGQDQGATFSLVDTSWAAGKEPTEDERLKQNPASLAPAQLRALRQHRDVLQVECIALVSPVIFAEMYAYFHARADMDGQERGKGETRTEDELVAFVYARISLDKSEVITKIFQLLYLEEEIRELEAVSRIFDDE
mmetsp:Transcript_42493/g.105326  ORF Transcript_42493/g.105326 Transcript_42493/m.105326 type:complete len:643 (-) Transcript_42493:2227-4155(-)